MRKALEKIQSTSASNTSDKEDVFSNSVCSQTTKDGESDWTDYLRKIELANQGNYEKLAVKQEQNQT